MTGDEMFFWGQRGGEVLRVWSETLEPEKLVVEAKKFIQAGWAADLNQLVTDALQRYLESHSADLTEALSLKTSNGFLHGRD